MKTRRTATRTRLPSRLASSITMEFQTRPTVGCSDLDRPQCACLRFIALMWRLPCHASLPVFEAAVLNHGRLTRVNLLFAYKVGRKTYVPLVGRYSNRRLHDAFCAGPIGFFQPRPIITLERARQESKLCMMGAVREVFAKTGVFLTLSV